MEQSHKFKSVKKVSDSKVIPISDIDNKRYRIKEDDVKIIEVNACEVCDLDYIIKVMIYYPDEDEYPIWKNPKFNDSWKETIFNHDKIPQKVKDNLATSLKNLKTIKMVIPNFVEFIKTVGLDLTKDSSFLGVICKDYDSKSYESSIDFGSGFKRYCLDRSVLFDVDFFKGLHQNNRVDFIKAIYEQNGKPIESLYLEYIENEDLLQYFDQSNYPHYHCPSKIARRLSNRYTCDMIAQHIQTDDYILDYNPENINHLYHVNALVNNYYYIQDGKIVFPCVDKFVPWLGEHVQIKRSTSDSYYMHTNYTDAFERIYTKDQDYFATFELPYSPTFTMFFTTKEELKEIEVIPRFARVNSGCTNLDYFEHFYSIVNFTADDSLDMLVLKCDKYESIYSFQYISNEFIEFLKGKNLIA